MTSRTTRTLLLTSTLGLLAAFGCSDDDEVAPTESGDGDGDLGGMSGDGDGDVTGDGDGDVTGDGDMGGGAGASSLGGSTSMGGSGTTPPVESDCEGTPPACEGLAQMECDRSGCTGERGCSGASASCPDNTTQKACTDAGCDWGFTCSGAPTACSAHAAARECNQSPGCNWTGM